MFGSVWEFVCCQIFLACCFIPPDKPAPPAWDEATYQTLRHQRESLLSFAHNQDQAKRAEWEQGHKRGVLSGERMLKKYQGLPDLALRVKVLSREEKRGAETPEERTWHELFTAELASQPHALANTVSRKGELIWEIFLSHGQLQQFKHSRNGVRPQKMASTCALGQSGYLLTEGVDEYIGCFERLTSKPLVGKRGDSEIAIIKERFFDQHAFHAGQVTWPGFGQVDVIFAEDWRLKSRDTHWDVFYLSQDGWLLRRVDTQSGAYVTVLDFQDFDAKRLPSARLEPSAQLLKQSATWLVVKDKNQSR